MKNDKQRCGTRRYHQSEMKNPTTLISGTVTPKWTVPGERNLQIKYVYVFYSSFCSFCVLDFKR